MQAGYEAASAPEVLQSNGMAPVLVNFALPELAISHACYF